MRATLLLLVVLAAPLRADFTGDIARRFLESDIDLQRSRSLVPFLPLAHAGVASYADTEVEIADGTNLEYDLSSVDQYAVLPILMSPRDALFVGEYLSHSEFDVSDEVFGDFDVSTVGLPVGWLRQASDDWQVGGFVMPMAHNSSLENSGWSYQVMGGVFGRYIAADNLWWLYGLYVDISAEDDFYIPYVGASWSINPHWTLSAVMPWPALLYAPNDRWLFSLGVSPSGASWNISSGRDDVAVNYDAWDFDLRIERHIHGSLWLGARAGVGGLRGARISGSDFEWPDIDVGSSGFFAIDLNFRPSVGNPVGR
jgi:hypothetical protein